MPILKLHSYEPETEPPAPLPFQSPDQSWRTAERTDEPGEEPMDSIARVEQALAGIDSKLEQLSEQADEYFEPIQLSHWISPNDDDGPHAA